MKRLSEKKKTARKTEDCACRDSGHFRGSCQSREQGTFELHGQRASGGTSEEKHRRMSDKSGKRLKSKPKGGIWEGGDIAERLENAIKTASVFINYQGCR